MSNSGLLISEANKEFNDQNYEAALSLYKKASELWGTNLFEVNMLLCKKKIRDSNNARGAWVSQPHIDPDGFRKGFPITHQKVSGAIPAHWPRELVLLPLPESLNDYRWAQRYRWAKPTYEKLGLSVIVPTYNRSNILDITLACLCNQNTDYAFEVIVADDGSQEPIHEIVRKYEQYLDIQYVRQRDRGYQLCAVRNLGIRAAKYDLVSILDCDMAPNKNWVQSYVEGLVESDQWALIGPRKYIDTSGLSASDFIGSPDYIETIKEVSTNSLLGNTKKGNVSIDWRLDAFNTTEDLRLCNTPFRYFSGGNVAFSKSWIEKIGPFDEEFDAWGGEDNEFAYRLFREGCFFRSISGGMAYHQEPPGKENETDRVAGKAKTTPILKSKVPIFYRTKKLKHEKQFERPLVSIYIPAYNAETTIVKAVNSALSQTVKDLEVCVCDDGSTDNTWDVLNENFSDNPRVKFVQQKNKGIGAASNAAVKLCSGHYIGQLDSDDYLLQDAVETCLSEFYKDESLVCVYTAYENEYSSSGVRKVGYNWPVYSREKFATAMIVHHFRMFTARAWSMTCGFDEKILNAVDYDIYLKLSEVGNFHHVNKVCYTRVVHGNNTSIKKLAEQKENHFFVVNSFLERQKAVGYRYAPLVPDDPACRKYVFVKS